MIRPKESDDKNLVVARAVDLCRLALQVRYNMALKKKVM